MNPFPGLWRALRGRRPLRVSLFNVHMITDDAVGQSVLNQARFFRDRGDEVRVYCQYVPPGAPAEVVAFSHVVNAETCQDDHFRTSDLYVFHYPSRYPLLDAMTAIDRGAVMLYFHNVTPPEFWDSEEDRALLKRSLDSVRELARFSDLIVTPSPFNADDLVHTHGCPRERVRVLPLAVPVDRFHPGPRDPALVERHRLAGRRVMLFVGRMARNKRPDLLLEALAHVVRDVPHAMLLLVGDTNSHPSFVELIARLEARAAELGLGDRLVVTGKVDDLPPYYRLADVYVTASLHEGFGVPLIEAMASGVPVVASRATAHPWVLQDAGLLAQPGDPVGLAAQIVRVLTDAALRATLVSRGLARAHACSMEHYASGLEKVVRESLALAPRAVTAGEPRWRA